VLDPVLKRVAARLGLAGEVTAQRLGKGLSNDTWLLRSEDDAVVVRQWQVSENRQRLLPEFEVSIWRAAAARHLAPEVRWADVAEGLVAAEYLADARPWTNEDLANPDNWGRLARLLSRFNQLEHPLPKYSPRAAAEVYLRALPRRGLDDRQRVLSEELLTLSAYYERHFVATAVCHHDLMPANILELPGGGLRLIDFEYAGKGHPFFDWATVAAFGDLDSTASSEFLQLMSRDAPPKAKAFPSVVRLVRLLAYFWTCVELQARPEEVGIAQLRAQLLSALD
jgi:thiamine kinase